MTRSFHSYQGQDRFVVDVCGGMRGGYFLDSGASDGTLGSNTRLLESEFGWRGICVEPNERLFARLAASRACICLNCCLYDRDGAVEFLEAAQVYGGILGEYEPAHLRFAEAFAAQSSPGSDADRPVTVAKPARTIRSVLRACGAPRVIDYWSLDTEGSELTLLRSFPFDEYRVRVLTVEHNHTAVREEIRAFLERSGFQRVASLGIDDGYVWVGHGDRAPWRSRAWSGRTRPTSDRSDG